MTERVPALFDRQRQLLQLVRAVGGTVGNLDLQKLLFWYCQEAGDRAPYEFVPYKFGAFSFTSYADRRKLIERGYLVDADHWQITAAGEEAIGASRNPFSAFVDKVGPTRGDALVAETYRRFPFFATRSEIADRVLGGDTAALARIQSAQPVVRGGGVVTIGYEGRTLESYLNELLRAGVTRLCDVRKNPISRKYGFAKSTLARGCEGVGIAYAHLPQLGIASAERQALVTPADYDRLFAEYARTTLPQQLAAIKQLAAWVRAGERIALTCYERLPAQCHRHCVAESVHRELGQGTTAINL